MHSPDQDKEPQLYFDTPGEAASIPNQELQEVIEGFRTAVKGMSLAELTEIFERPAVEPASLILRALIHKEIERRMRG